MIIGLFLFAVGLRFFWEANPSTASCVAFWLAIFVAHLAWIYQFRCERVRFVAGIVVGFYGMAMNAAVTIANGGRMPSAHLRGTGESIWVQLAPQHQLAGFADVLWAGMSVGDVLLFSGGALTIAMALIRLLSVLSRPRFAPEPMEAQP